VFAAPPYLNEPGTTLKYQIIGQAGAKTADFAAMAIRKYWQLMTAADEAEFERAMKEITFALTEGQHPMGAA
jgi:hypothetical protein